MEIQIISGFMGAGKTTFLNQYLPCLPGRTAVIQNEIGEVKLDRELIAEDLPVEELTSGCICCTLAANLQKTIRELSQNLQPDRILIEPSGVGKLSDVYQTCRKLQERDGLDLEVTGRIVLLDAGAFEEYMDGFGAFYADQITWAGLILFTHLEEMTEEEKERAGEGVRRLNPEAVLFTGDYRALSGEELLALARQAGGPVPQEDEMAVCTSPGGQARRLSSQRPLIQK